MEYYKKLAEDGEEEDSLEDSLPKINVTAIMKEQLEKQRQ